MTRIHAATLRRVCLFGLLAGCHAATPTALTPTPARYRLVYQGTGELEGHYRRPGERRPFHMSVDVSVDGELRRLTVKSWDEADPDDAHTEVHWIRGDLVVRATGTLRYDSSSGPEATWARQLVEVGRVVERPLAHPTFGDVVERVAATGTATLGGVAAPGRLELARHEDDVAWTASLQRVTAVAPPEPLAMPAVTPSAPAAAPGSIEITAVDSGVYIARIPAADTASLVVEVSDGLAVVESSLTVAHGEALVDAIHARFPGRPIRHVLFSHYHPHYTGGLRAFFADGATLHAPPRGAAYGRSIAARSFTLAPDRLARSRAPARVDAFHDRFAIDDVLEAFDIGADSDHTDEYVVVYLPRSGIVFQGDLGWSVRADGTVRTGRRSAGLRKALEARQLVIKRLIQGWPVMPQHQVITLEEWQRAFAAPPP